MPRNTHVGALVLISALVSTALGQVVQFEPRLLPVEVPLPGGGIAKPGYLALADFDEDGDDDLVAWDIPGYFGVIKATNGVFMPGIAYSLGGSSGVWIGLGGRHLADVADVDGDGDQDVVLVGSMGGPVLLTFLNDGNGGFGSPPIQHSLSSVSSAGSLTVAHVNNDTIPDVFIAGGSTVPFRVCLGTGGGAFASMTTGFNLPPARLAIEDDDQDGDDDLHLVTGSNFVTYRNDGQGAFQSPVIRFAVGPHASWPHFSEFNGDGIPDVMIADEPGFATSSYVVIATGTAQGTFVVGAPQLVTTLGLSTTQLGDFDGDGDPDMLVVPSVVSRLLYFENTGVGAFLPGRLIDTPSFSRLVGDVNGDGIADALEEGITGFLSFRAGHGNHEGLGPAIVDMSYPLPGGGPPAGPAKLVNLDLDGYGDLVLGVQNGLTVVPGVAAGGTPQFVPLPSHWVFDIASADLDRDGHVDLILTSAVLGPIEVGTVLGNGAGGFGPATWLGPSATPILGVKSADVNRDGNPDAVVLKPAAIEVLPGDGAGGLGPPLFTTAILPVPVGITYSAISRPLLNDLNQDGLVDLVVVYPFSAPTPWSFSVFLGNGGGFAFAANYPGTGAVDVGALEDVSGDGIPDFLVMTGSPRGLTVRHGLGDGSFAAPATTPLPVIAGGFVNFFGPLEVGDIDGDGDADAMTHRGAVFMNDGTGAFSLQGYVGAAEDRVVLGHADRDLQLDAVFVGGGAVFPYLNLTPCSCEGFRYGLGCPGTGGIAPTLGARGCASPGSFVVFEVASGLGGAPAVLVLDAYPWFTPVGFGCTALLPFVDPSVFPFMLGGAPFGGVGRASFSVVIPPTFPTGVSVAMQVVVADPVSPFTASASNGLSLLIQ